METARTPGPGPETTRRTLQRVALIIFMLAAVSDYTAEVAPEVWRRMLAIVLDGLAVERAAPSELAVAPMSVEDLDAAMTGWRPAR